MSESKASEDDVQYLYERPADTIKCEICSTNLQKLTVQQRQEHYETHFSDAPNRGVHLQPSSSKFKPSAKSNFFTSHLKRKRAKSGDQDVFWHPSQGTPPPDNFTPGVIQMLKKALVKSHAKGITQRAYLCCERAVHVGAQGWDRGWGCGYRNFEMMCVPLMEEPQQPVYFALLDSPIPPSVRNLQKWLEAAWKEGYDEDGAAHFKHKLVGTSKWIGTADIYVALTSRGIPANLIDFDLSSRGSDLLTQWIVSHFTQDPPKPAHATVNDALRGAAPVVVTNCLPIVLQHSGHSRTVVGYERCTNGSVNLLMFDPSRAVPSSIRTLALASHSDTIIRAHPTHEPPGSNKLSPKKLLNHVLHPTRSRDEMQNGPAAKRARAEEDTEVKIVETYSPASSSSKTTPSLTEGDVTQVLKHFRLASNSLKRNKYQVLYFPLTDPLDESQRRARREVTSMKINK